MKYIINKIEITDPTIKLLKVDDAIIEKVAVVTLSLETESAKVAVEVGQFSYKETWTDDEALDFGLEKLKKYEYAN
jgi:hypothetical protein